MPASAKSNRISPSWVRAASYAGRRPASAPEGADWTPVIGSGRPGEVRGREACLAFVLDAEGVDLRTLRLGHRQVRPGRVEHPVELDRLAVLLAERDDVLDLEVDRVTDSDAVPQSVVDDLDRGSLDTEHLADQWSHSCHRSAQLPAEDPDQLLELLVA